MKISTDAIEAHYHRQRRKRAAEKSLNGHTAVALLMVVMVLMLSLPLAHAGGIKVGRNVDIAGDTFPDFARVETTIAVDPRNPDIIAAGAIGDSLVANGGFVWDEYFRSIDAGLTWSSMLLPGFPGDTSPRGLSSPLHGLVGTGDPFVAFDSSGNLYYTGIGFPSGIFVVKFANDGRDFVGGLLMKPLGFTDFPKVAVDTTGGPNNGNVYLTFPTGGTSVTGVFTRSTNGGLSFSDPKPIPGAGAPKFVAVDAAGNVYIVSLHCTGVSVNCTSDASAQILVSKSSDAGLTFQIPVIAATIRPIPSPLPGNIFRTSTLPQMAADASGVYIVTDDFSAGDSNVLFSRSTDGGVTWSSPIRVNDVTQGQQFFPAITSSGGIISVAWYDSRLGQLSNGTITGLDVFYAESRDAGSSFSKNVRVTSASYNPNVASFPPPLPLRVFIGDYIGIAASPNTVHPIWTDERNICDTALFGFCQDVDAMTATITP